MVAELGTGYFSRKNSLSDLVEIENSENTNNEGQDVAQQQSLLMWSLGLCLGDWGSTWLLACLCEVSLRQRTSQSGTVLWLSAGKLVRAWAALLFITPSTFQPFFSYEGVFKMKHRMLASIFFLNCCLCWCQGLNAGLPTCIAQVHKALCQKLS